MTDGLLFHPADEPEVPTTESPTNEVPLTTPDPRPFGEPPKTEHPTFRVSFNGVANYWSTENLNHLEIYVKTVIRSRIANDMPATLDIKVERL